MERRKRGGMNNYQTIAGFGSRPNLEDVQESHDTERMFGSPLLGNKF